MPASPDPAARAADVAAICRLGFIERTPGTGSAGEVLSLPGGGTFQVMLGGVQVTVTATAGQPRPRRFSRHSGGVSQSAAAGRDCYVSGGDSTIIRNG